MSEPSAPVSVPLLGRALLPVVVVWAVLSAVLAVGGVAFLVTGEGRPGVALLGAACLILAVATGSLWSLGRQVVRREGDELRWGRGSTRAVALDGVTEVRVGPAGRSSVVRFASAGGRTRVKSLYVSLHDPSVLVDLFRPHLARRPDVVLDPALDELAATGPTDADRRLDERLRRVARPEVTVGLLVAAAVLIVLATRS